MPAPRSTRPLDSGRSGAGGPAPDRGLLPLVRRFPALAAVPRVALGSFPSPVERAAAIAPSLWLKREDLAAEPLGGNKVRALEFLLGGLAPGALVVTVGAYGSTHALAVATYARAIGLRAEIHRWPQEMNAVADLVARRIESVAARAPRSRSVAGAYGRALVARLRGARWIPAGGSSPLGVLGHVNAALELAEQIERGALPAPARIVLPLGTGGTMAGLALGLAIAGVDTEVVGVRVVPRAVANLRRVRALARATARLIERRAGERLPSPRLARLRLIHDHYGGAYGRDTAAARAAAARCATGAGLVLDTTYAAKTFAAALALADDTRQVGPTLFWLTFDGRWLSASP